MAEKNSDKKLEEANFEVSSLAEVKDENGNGIFHMRTKTKVILFVSTLILLAAGALIYFFVEKYINAEIWQVAIWGLCGVLAIYSIFSKSIPTMMLNLILFAGLSFIPIWQSGYDTFRPIIEKFSTQPAEQPIPAPAQIPDTEKFSEPQDKNSDAEKVESDSDRVSDTEKNSEPEKKVLEPLQEKSSVPENKLPSI